MSHARSGLPPLNLEPFDPAPLYAAARSPRREKHQPNHRQPRGPMFARLSLALGLVAALAAAGAYLLV